MDAYGDKASRTGLHCRCERCLHPRAVDAPCSSEIKNERAAEKVFSLFLDDKGRHCKRLGLIAVISCSEGPRALFRGGKNIFVNGRIRSRPGHKGDICKFCHILSVKEDRKNGAFPCSDIYLAAV